MIKINFQCPPDAGRIAILPPRQNRPERDVSEEARIETLEIKVAHLERAQQELSDVVFRQQQRLDALAARHASLLERLEGAAGAAGPESQFEVPPHY